MEEGTSEVRRCYQQVRAFNKALKDGTVLPRNKRHDTAHHFSKIVRCKVKLFYHYMPYGPHVFNAIHLSFNVK